MKKIVLDSSVIVKWLNKNKEDYIDQADMILKDANMGKVSLYAPELAKYEIGKVLVLGKKLTQSEAKIALTALFDLPIQFVLQTKELAQDAHAIASEFGLSYAESVFLALAEQRGAVYVASIMSPQAKPQGLKIILLKDYSTSSNTT